MTKVESRIHWSWFTLLVLCAWLLRVQVSPGQPESQPSAQCHAETAFSLAQAGDLSGAERELRRALELSPGDPSCLSSLGSILGMQQKLEESNTLFEQALKIKPNDWATRRNLASNQFQLGLLGPAKKNLERVLELRPTDKTSILLLGMVAEELRDYVAAIRHLESVRDAVHERPQSLTALARSYYNTKAKEKARETLEQLKNHTAGAEGIFLGAQVAAEVGDFETAERMFASIESTYPDRAKLAYQLALVRYHTGRIEESQRTLRRLIDDGHQSSDIFNLLAWCLYKQGDLKEAVAAMDLAIDRDPARETHYLDLGLMLVSHKRLPVALEAARKAVKLAPRSYQVQMLKGLVEAKMNHLIEAAQTYARAVELNPDAPEAQLALALVESADGKRPEAEATFKKALERFPRDAVLHQEYAKLLLKFGAGDSAAQSRARALLQTALSLDSSLPESHYQLGNLAFTRDHIQEAARHLEKAIQLNPKSSKTHFALARVYRRLVRTEEASQELALYERCKAEEEKPIPAGASRGEEPGLPDLAQDTQDR
jgi:tetratricopeptide (TPR) repeat protein